MISIGSFLLAIILTLYFSIKRKGKTPILADINDESKQAIWKNSPHGRIAHYGRLLIIVLLVAFFLIIGSIDTQYDNIIRLAVFLIQLLMLFFIFKINPSVEVRSISSSVFFSSFTMLANGYLKDTNRGSLAISLIWFSLILVNILYFSAYFRFLTRRQT